VPEERLPRASRSPPTFVVVEGLTNVVRYAEASRAWVAVGHADGTLVVEVGDDGIGGADLAGGTGLRGLASRVTALDGRLDLSSAEGEGTILRAEIPCAS